MFGSTQGFGQHICQLFSCRYMLQCDEPLLAVYLYQNGNPLQCALCVHERLDFLLCGWLPGYHRTPEWVKCRVYSVPSSIFPTTLTLQPSSLLYTLLQLMTMKQQFVSFISTQQDFLPLILYNHLQIFLNQDMMPNLSHRMH